MPTKYTIRVRGPSACFTLPYGPERTSSLIPSHDAAAAILGAIYGPREVAWVVPELHLLKMPRRMTLSTNEIKEFPSDNLNSIAIEDQRTQRINIILRDVDFLLVGYLTPSGRGTHKTNAAKMNEVFQRRIRKGQFYTSPYLGQREYGADVELIEGPLPKPVDHSENFGLHYFGYDFQAKTPYFCPLQMEKGIVRYPTWDTVMSSGMKGTAA